MAVVVAFDGDGNNRQSRLGGGYAGQVGRAAGAGDDNFQTPVSCSANIVTGFFRRAVGGQNADFVGDAEFVQDFGRDAHNVQVRIRSHDDADGWLLHA